MKSLSLCVAAALSVLFMALAAGTAAEKAKEKQHVVSSAYLSAALEIDRLKARRVALNVRLDDTGGKGDLMLDPNTCSLNAFGDPDICTEIAPSRHKVKLHRLRTKDPKGLGRRVYSVSGEGLPKHLRLIVPTDAAKASFRLLIGTEKHRRVVTLEPTAC